MQKVRDIQRYFGEAWTGVKFYFDGATAPEKGTRAGLRFCEAVARARSGPLVLQPGDVSCPGANYVFRWDGKLRDTIAAQLAEDRGMSPESSGQLISQVPVLDRPPAAIGLNTDDVPDVIVSYCQPATAMQFLKVWQATFGGRNLVSSLSSVLSVCGNVCVGSYLSKKVSLSLACDEAREWGDVGRDRMVIGIPYPLIEKLTASNLDLKETRVPQRSPL